MNYETLDIAIDGRGVARLTLSRPEKHNAMSAKMIAELTAAADELERAEAVRLVVLSGAGRSFCAGGDLDWMKAQFAATRAARIAEARRLAMMLRGLNEMPKPMIGRVHGAAYGGGVGLLAVCDSVIAVDDAKFGLTETRLGLIPATISPYVMARIGETAARRVMLSGKTFSAAEAQALGLVAKVVPGNTLDPALETEIAPFFAAAPKAAGAAKRLARGLGPRIDDALIESTIIQLADTWESEDAQEGIAAFLEKRKPRWMSG